MSFFYGGRVAANGIFEKICDLLAESFKKKPVLEMMAVQEETTDACRRFGVELPAFLDYLGSRAGVSDDAFYGETLAYFTGRACKQEKCLMAQCAAFSLVQEISAAVSNSFINLPADAASQYNFLKEPCRQYGMIVKDFVGCLLRIRVARLRQ